MSARFFNSLCPVRALVRILRDAFGRLVIDQYFLGEFIV